MIPFLLLVAAMQGGLLLQLPLGDAPITTLMPLLGGWALVAALISRQPKKLRRPSIRAGALLGPSLVALAAVVALTALAQVWRPGGRTFSLTEVLTLVQLGVLVVLTAYLLHTPRRVIWVAYVTVAAGVAVSLLAFADQAGLVTVGGEKVYAEGYTRVSGLLDDPNFFSFQLLLAVGFCVHLALAAKTISGRVMFWAAFIAIFVGIVSTYSAGALVGLGAVLGATLLLLLRVSGKRALLAFAAIAAVTVVVAVTAPPDYGEAIADKFKQTTSGSFEQLGTKRGAAWEAAAREVGSNPVIGVGLASESLQRAIGEHYTLTIEPKKAAHNMYLSIAVGTGMFGLIIVLVILGSCLSVLWTAYSKAAREGLSETTLATACLFTALVVVTTQGLQLDLQLEKFTWLLIGASLAVRYWSVESPNPSDLS